MSARRRLISELFPSLYSISEIRISESTNSAEFSGTSDITTISKSGTNSFHGGLLRIFSHSLAGAQ